MASADKYVPQTWSAGIRTTFQLALTAYPASQGWQAVLYLRGADAIDVLSVADNNLHVFDVTSAVSTAWKAGHYGYSLRVKRGADADLEMDEIESGVVQIMADVLNLSAGQDFRSHAQRTLDAIEAVLESRATMDQERYRINNRELYRTPIETLKKLRDQYRAEVAREIAKAKGKSLFGQCIRYRLQ